ncbi:SecC motif-containing protein [Puniceicoccales bacterium CK1056]|uniref:UPF0225 protein G0Q06_03240 n=1 Tax=Oceanipulchritudo coccoides TaxID=2706888 RepID=A0A6B2LXV1_9BACT|nr:YchJ family metal-binding protein [Oceanipulchritudo coccoides]NDV61458.1 SecC motif-containing protein [Oceanipulchritudo coccoides]
MTDGIKLCACASGLAYADCCRSYHLGVSKAPTALALMRSRYCAYVIGEIDYLVQTTLPAARKADLRDSYKSTYDSINWIGLEVVTTWLGGENDKIGKVEFRAFYIQDGQRSTHHEVSRFRRSKGLWFYVDGQVEDSRQ